tara:strand:- start:2241 stop:4280 length:2040 start_codon:yes stop_codon:yes gene_type:complete
VNYILKFITIAIITFYSQNSLYALESNWGISEFSKVRLISPLSHNNNQNQIYVGLEYQMDPGWKTYWKSPGDAGFAQEISWENSSNIKNLEIKWPTPIEFEILGLKSIGYKDKVIFPLIIDLIDPNKKTQINISTNYLVCKDICLPGKGNLQLDIPSGKAISSKYFFDLEKSISKLPQKNINLEAISNIDIETKKNNEFIIVNVEASTELIFNNPKIYLHTSYGLPFIEPILEYSLDYKTLKAFFYFNKELINSQFMDISVLIKDKKHNFEFDSNTKINQSSNLFFSDKIITFLFIALIGGLILNVMPCVFPVLSIKLMSVLETKKTETRISFLITSIGIITSFILLAFIFSLMRQSNMNIYWGMQFQQPFFIMIIAMIISSFMLNMFGFFEFRLPSFINLSRLNSFGNNKYTKPFFNGFLATILATPCSAPFVGSAITVAFTQSTIIMFIIFFAMGFGMSIPYLLISLFPNLVNILPKPGKWMKYIKYFMGLLLLVALLWISNIILNHFNYYFIIASICLLIISIFILINNFYKTILTFIVLTIFFSLPFFSIFNQKLTLSHDKDWKNFLLIDFNDLILTNEIIFIDITADWCATCQFNKMNILNKKEIKEIFSKNNVIKVRADWSVPNNKIEMFLSKHNRFGIPFNAFFSKKYPKGIILSELLSEKEMLKVVEEIKN